ncbi:hypothetical protein U1Q18_005696 [Sarracenia purpurea var. burkii]
MDSIRVWMTRLMSPYLEQESIQPLPALELSSATAFPHGGFEFNPRRRRRCRSDRVSANAVGYREEEGERVHDDEPDSVALAVLNISSTAFIRLASGILPIVLKISSWKRFWL